MVASPSRIPRLRHLLISHMNLAKGSKETVIGECQKEEAAGLAPSNFPVPCSCACLRGPHTLILGGASSGPPMCALFQGIVDDGCVDMTMLRRYKMLLGRKRDVCARVLCASIHGLLYQLKMSKAIRQRFNLLDVPLRS
jgi:hypothetical protein